MLRRLVLVGAAIAAFGGSAAAQYLPGNPVTDGNPYPTKDAPYVGAENFAVGVVVPPRRALAIYCTAAGNVQIRLADDSTLTIPTNVGFSLVQAAVKQVVAAGTTASCSFANLK